MQPLCAVVPTYFNSIKVRLKRAKELAYIKKHTFQFHKGTIKTRQRVAVQSSQGNFNSIKVRLKPRFLPS